MKTKSTPANIARSLEVIRSVLDGDTFGGAAARLSISRTRAHQLHRRALKILIHPAPAWGDKLPSDDLEIAELRRHKEFWHRRVAIARERLHECAVHNVDRCTSCRVNAVEFLQLRSMK